MYKLRTVNNNIDFFKSKCESVECVNEEIIQILDEMLDFIYKNNCIGLASIQLGILKRLVVIDSQENNIKSPMFLINPHIIQKSTNMINSIESSPIIFGEFVNIERHENIVVKYLDKNKKENIKEAQGLLAICLQHEIDHLDGKIILDHCSKLKKDFILKKIKKKGEI